MELQGWAKFSFIGCENISRKLRMKRKATTGTKIHQTWEESLSPALYIHVDIHSL